VDKELKKQIREDELVTAYQKSAAWWVTHRESARLAVGIVALLAAAAAAVVFYQGQRNETAAKAFADAFEVMEAPVTSVLPPGADKPTGLSFATPEEKYKSAAAAFEGIDRRYPSLPLGRRAKYMGALARLEMGDAAAAESALKELAARRDLKELEPTLARLALGDLYRRTGRLDQAIEAYQQFAADTTVSFPRDYALLSLGETQEEAKKPGEAKASYERLVQEFPASVYSPEARRRADFLGSAS
jgi:outer membrane protein assembly factor BamD (BamD/ComL family)